MSSGTDQVDVAEVQRRGLPLGNTPKVLDDAVADIAIGLLISASRRFKEGIREIESGTWKYGVNWTLGQDIAGSTVGVVGFGGIGQAVVKRLRGFDVAKFLYYGPREKPEAKSLNVERCTLEELLSKSDHVLLACPLTPETKNMINDTTLKLMKKNAVLVNVARGGLVDQDALYNCLKEGGIFAAGLDVVTPEPISKDHPLVTLPNCFIVPHMGSATIKTRIAMSTIAANNIIRALNGKPNLALVWIVLCRAADGLPAHNLTMTKNLKVVVSSNDFPDSGLKILKEHFTVVQTKFINFGEEGRRENHDDLMNIIPGASALVWISNLPITKELLDKAGPQLKIVSTASAGYNHCNVDELKARGIKLSNTPEVLSPAVAEIAITLMLGAARRFTENLDQVRRGEWEIGFAKVLGQDIRGSTVGVIGLGGIGQAVVKRLAGFEVGRVLYTGRKEKPQGKALGAEYVSLDSLLEQSDFILLAVPLTDQTRHIINKTTLGKMKKNAILVNVGRGELVDQDALYDALKDHSIYAAGLDVTSPEPLPKDHKLLTLPNIFILPHIGSATLKTRSDMGVLAANNIVNALSGKPLLTPILQ